MSIHIYNTLTRQKEPFRPLQDGQVKMYVCGPTVYNHVHIGNTRPVLFFDVVRRYFTYKGYDVLYVHNFTDIDDRIIDTSQQLGKTAQEVAEKYIVAYYDVLSALDIPEADHHPRVTENIGPIIEFIQRLVDKGCAYEADGDVYYRTGKFPGYGKLSQQNTDELLSGVRIDVQETKDSALDFALWKKAEGAEMAWDSPWGRGRPGWHIECSAMIRKYLGDQIDIHGGGIDLTFPHHENEIAQTEGLTGQPLATYWMHNALLTIDEQKMSKSAGNFVLADDVLQHYTADTVRFFMLSGHYRSPLQYSVAGMEQAKRGYERLFNTLANIEHRLAQAGDTEQPTSDHEHKTHQRTIEKWRTAFITSMDDDFNTANALSVLFELAKAANIALGEMGTTASDIRAYGEALQELAGVLGFQWGASRDLMDAEVEKLIEERTQARKDKNFARADDIRDQLHEQGITLEDTPHGVRWRRQ